MAQRRRTDTLRCRVLGHDFDFTADLNTMTWQCSRCSAGASKSYPTPADAARFAATFNSRDFDDLGKRAPLIGLLPLRLWRRWRRPRES